MLIEFTVGNFLSFKDKKTLDLNATSITELPENVVKCGSHKLLRSAVVYGANSSGKSNLIKAIDRMKKVVLSSVKLNDGEALHYTPFLLSSETEHAPSHFEIEFLIESTKYRYGFEYNETQIVNEWFFQQQGSRKEQMLFIRTLEGIDVDDRFKEGAGKEEATNDNRLFLSLVAQLGGNTSKRIISWFLSYNVISGIENYRYSDFSKSMFHERSNGYAEALDLFKTLQLGFNDIVTQEDEIINISDLPKGIPKELLEILISKKTLSINTIHNKYDKAGNPISTVVFDKDEQESEGTKKMIDLFGPLFDSLLLGTMLVVDELDAKLHPLISQHIIRLFHNPSINRHNAQLIFATHDTNLLSIDFFRRDQIWFTEKDKMEQTDLYSLVEFKLPDGTSPRKDSNYERNYIKGRYGAIPFITANSGFNLCIPTENQQDDHGKED